MGDNMISGVSKFTDQTHGIGGEDTSTTPQQQALLNSQQQGLTAEQQQLLKQLGDQNLLQPQLLAALGITKNADGSYSSGGTGDKANALQDQQFGDIMAGDPEQQQINSLLRQRQINALNGTGPSDPTMERNLQLQEQQLRSQLQAQLGSGYETSTPGMQALADFQTSANEQRFTNNQALLTNAAGINNANYTTGVNQATAASNASSAKFANIFNTMNMQNPTNSLLQSNTAGFTAPISSIFNQTQLGAQTGVANSNVRLGHGKAVMGIF